MVATASVLYKNLRQDFILGILKKFLSTHTRHAFTLTQLANILKITLEKTGDQLVEAYNDPDLLSRVDTLRNQGLAEMSAVERLALKFLDYNNYVSAETDMKTFIDDVLNSASSTTSTEALSAIFTYLETDCEQWLNYSTVDLNYISLSMQSLVMTLYDQIKTWSELTYGISNLDPSYHLIVTLSDFTTKLSDTVEKVTTVIQKIEVLSNKLTSQQQITTADLSDATTGLKKYFTDAKVSVDEIQNQLVKIYTGDANSLIYVAP